MRLSNAFAGGLAPSFCALIAAAAAQAATLTATPATLNAVAKTAKGGDVIRMAPGAGYVQLNNSANPMLTFPSPGVTVDMSAMTDAVFYGANVSNLTVLGGSYRPQGWQGCVYIAGFANVAVKNVTCARGGVSLDDGVNGLLENNSLSEGAVFVRKVKGFRVTGTQTTAADADGIDIDPCSSFGRIDHNVISGSSAKENAHPDAVQIQNPTPACPTGARSIEIDHNKATGSTQGYDAWGGGVALYVHDNEVFNNYSWGGALDGCKGCTLANNHVGTMAGAPWQSGFDTRGSADIVRCGNAVDAYTARDGQHWAGGKERACKPEETANAAARVAP